MTVKVTVHTPPLQLWTAEFERDLINKEMIALQNLLAADELKSFFGEGERYCKPRISRSTVRWYPRNEAAAAKIVAVINAFADTLEEGAHEPHPEKLSYDGGVLSLRS